MVAREGVLQPVPTEQACDTSAAGSAPCACQATATVLHACAGKGDGHAELSGGLGGAERCYAAGCPLSTAMGGSVARKTPAQAGQGATDAKNEPSARVALRTGRRSRAQRARCTVDM